MGLYTWLSKEEFERYSHVEDKDINEVLQEVRRVWPVWYINERDVEYKERLFGPIIKEKIYSIYQSCGGEEVREQTSAIKKKDVLNFFYGLNLGLHKELYKTD